MAGDSILFMVCDAVEGFQKLLFFVFFLLNISSTVTENTVLRSVNLDHVSSRHPSPSFPFLSRIFPTLCRTTLWVCCWSSWSQFYGTQWARGKSSADAKDLINMGEISYVFMFAVAVLLMYTPKQPEAHSSLPLWLTWQSAWQSLRTQENLLRLHSHPVLPCSAPSPPYPLPSWRATLSTTQPSISHASACLAHRNQAYSFCQAVSLSCQRFWKQLCSVKLAHHMQQKMLPTYTKLSK